MILIIVLTVWAAIIVLGYAAVRETLRATRRK